MGEWQWERGAESLERAIELDPAYTWAYHVYAMQLTLQGRFDEAIEQMQRARRIEPVSTSPTGIDLGYVYSLQGDLESAAEAWQESLELSPDNYRIHRHLGNHFCLAGDYEKGLAALERATSLLHDEERLLSDLGYCHGLAGNRDEAREYLRKIEARATQMYVDPMNLALVHLGLGEKDRTLELLEDGYATRAQLLSELATDPRYASIRSDPHFEAIVRGMGLERPPAPPKG
jgi:tetratricopeptide (TPR) repeat protein